MGVGGGGRGYMPFQYHQKPFLEDDRHHKTFPAEIETPTNDEEDCISSSSDDHHDSKGDYSSNYEPFNLNERTLYWESQEALIQVCIVNISFHIFSVLNSSKF